MRSNAVSCLVPLVCHLVTTMLTTRKLVKSVPSLSKTSKNVFADYDLILGPTAPSVAFDLDSLNHDPVAMYLADLLTIPVNLAGLPGISIPAGFAQGLPVGLQLIGPKYSEETIYQAAAAFEATTDYHKQQPPYFRR